MPSLWQTWFHIDIWRDFPCSMSFVVFDASLTGSADFSRWVRPGQQFDARGGGAAGGEAGLRAGDALGRSPSPGGGGGPPPSTVTGTPGTPGAPTSTFSFPPFPSGSGFPFPPGGPGGPGGGGPPKQNGDNFLRGGYVTNENGVVELVVSRNLLR